MVLVLAAMLYEGVYLPFIFNPQRSDIVKATYEPTDEECEWKADEEQELTVSMQIDVMGGPRKIVVILQMFRVQWGLCLWN